MTSGVEQHGQHPRRLLVALVLAVLALVVGVGVGVDAHASSSAGQVPGERVAAHELAAGPVVAASEDIAAGEGRRTTTGAPDLVSGSRVAPRAASGAESAAQGARLRTHLRLSEEYGSGGIRELADGRIRYYDMLDPARKPGPMAGRRLVREWDPASGGMRTWHETLD